MTVAAVVFEGANSAERLHESAMKALNPKYLELVKELKKQRRKLPSMHFIDMSDADKSAVGERLARANVSVFSASFWFESTTAMEHEERFSIYTQLVKLVIIAAFAKHKELEIAVGKQGGWQEYERDFLAELKQIPKDLAQHGEYRKGEIYLTSAVKPGIQLADFYVGGIRDYHRDMPNVHSRIKHQVHTYDVYRQTAVDKKER